MSEETLDPATARRLATSLAALLEAAGRQVKDENESELVAWITGHLGCSLADAPNVTMSFGGWEHVNLQRGLDAYLAEHGPDAAWFGVAGGGRMHQDIMDMLSSAAQGATYQLGAVDYATVATGPDSVTEAVQLGLLERHVVRGAEHNARLVALGQHLKRGLLLYGPPGTGKTHTIRYLMSRLTDATVVVLSGRALMLLPAASALVRRLQPSVLVIEDVDLIAQDRSMGPGSHPLLFELLNRIDGVDSDADVTFVLTTNRVDVLEQALVDRPGRVDLAVEIPKPDTEERARLLRLYSRDVDLDLPDPTGIVAALDGVTASFVRELVRRAVLRRLDEGDDNDDRVAITEATLHAVLEELLSQQQGLTRRILGGAQNPVGSVLG